MNLIYLHFYNIIELVDLLIYYLMLSMSNEMSPCLTLSYYYNKFVYSNKKSR